MKPFVSLNNRELEDFYFYLLRHEDANRPRTSALRETLLNTVEDALDHAGVDTEAINA
jgi:hypothetical protein